MEGKTPLESTVDGLAYCELNIGACGPSVGPGGSYDETGEVTLDALLIDG